MSLPPYIASVDLLQEPTPRALLREWQGLVLTIIADYDTKPKPGQYKKATTDAGAR